MKIDENKSIWVGECVPYSKEACEDVVERLGLQKGGKGFNFVENFAIKGCYSYESGSYANIAYYGSGGSEQQMATQLNSPKYRPAGYDCSTTGNIDTENRKLLYILCNSMPFSINFIVFFMVIAS